MFFFFVGGLEQQVRQVVKAGAGRCIVCGSKADLVYAEKVLKLFFVPVWKWPSKEPVMHCNSCSLFFPSYSQSQSISESEFESSSSLPDVLRCYSCSRVIDPDFRFCPFCGASL